MWRTTSTSAASTSPWKSCRRHGRRPGTSAPRIVSVSSGLSHRREVVAVMAEVEIGIGKSGRRAYGFDDIAIVPSRRTRDPEDVDISWEIDAFRFDAAAHGVRHGRRRVSPATAIEIGRLGGVGVLNLEGLWTRYEDPEPLFDEIAELPTPRRPPAGCRSIYAEPIKPELIGAAHPPRSRTPASSPRVGHPAAHRSRCAEAIIDAELDLLVIQGTVVSAEHVSKHRRAAQPQALRPPARHPRHRRRLRQLPGRPAPHAHRRRRRPRRRRPRPRLHHPRRPRHRRPAGHRHRRRPRRPHAPPRRDRRLRATSSPTAAWAPAATSPRPSCAAPTPS